MDIKDVKKIIAHGESKTVEYKQSIAELDKLGQAMSGLLNVDGGYGLIGVNDKGNIVGVEVNDSTKKKLTIFLNHFDPSPDITVEYVGLSSGDKQVIVFVCHHPSNDKPYTYKGRAYIKTESGKKLMPVERYRQMSLENVGLSKAWESMIAEGFSIDNLDYDEIVKSFKMGLHEKRIPEDEYTEEPKEILTHFDLIQEGAINNAAMVLFAKKTPSEYPQCFIRMGRFIDDTMDEVIDSSQFRGNAFQILNGAQDFIRKHLPISSRYSADKFERIDEAALPLLAVREAIINAICHRDYSNRAGDISLYIFNDCLEIHNIGHLYGGLTVDQLYVKHPSRRRNEKIAQVFHARKLIDRFGGGTRRIVRLCKEQQLPDPKFSEESDGFQVKFFFKEPIGPHKKIIGSGGSHRFSSREKELLDILATHGKLQFKEIVNYLENPPSDRTIRNELSSLRDKQLIVSDGHGRGATWFIKAKE